MTEGQWKRRKLKMLERWLLERRPTMKRGGFIEKYKDSIGTIASLCAIATPFLAGITFILQLTNSYHAAQFYNIEYIYFLQESIGHIIFDTLNQVIGKIITVVFPIVVFFIMQPFQYNVEENNKRNWFMNTVAVIMYILSFALYIQCSFASFSIFERTFFFGYLPKWASVLCFSPWIILLIIVELETARLNIIQIVLSLIFLFIYELFFITSIISPVYPKDIDEAIIFLLFSLYYFSVQCAFKYRNQKINGLGILFIALCTVIILLVSFVPLGKLGYMMNYKKFYFSKSNYEIVRKQSSLSLDCLNNPIVSDSNLQVVILHSGSQVLLMNCKITSSSNLEIDTGSYELQEASQYRFYRKEFKNVTTNTPRHND